MVIVVVVDWGVDEVGGVEVVVVIVVVGVGEAACGVVVAGEFSELTAGAPPPNRFNKSFSLNPP